MASFGLTEVGFVPKTLSDIDADLTGDMQGEFGVGVDLDPRGPFGQLKGIMSERLAEVWDLAQAIYAAFDPDETSGAAQDALAALTGTLRDGATSSQVIATLTGTVGTVIATGKAASVTGTGVRFVTKAPATLVSLTAWAPSTTYAIGDRRSSGGNSYVCTVGGASASSGGPSSTAADIVDGAVHWRFIGPGTAAADVAMQSQDTGPKTAPSGSLTVIETAVSGWNGVVNLLDAQLGANIETDASLALRREEELRSGLSALEAVRAAVQAVPGVTTCNGFENTSDSVDADGMPPHSLEMVVVGGDDTALLAAIFAARPAGISAEGTTTGTVTDAEGNAQPSAFSRPTDFDIYVTANILVDANKYPIDGENQVKEVIVDWADPIFVPGKDVVASRIAAQLFDVPGVIDVVSLLIGTAPTPTLSTTIPTSLRQQAKFDTSRIVIKPTPGTL